MGCCQESFNTMDVGYQAMSPSQGVVDMRGQVGNEVAEFLLRSGLQQYTEVLLQSGFDEMGTLLEIHEEDMKDMGILPGHIIKLRKRLRKYNGNDQQKAPVFLQL